MSRHLLQSEWKRFWKHTCNVAWIEDKQPLFFVLCCSAPSLTESYRQWGFFRKCCLSVCATCSSPAYITVKITSSPSQCYAHALLSLFFKKIEWEKSKVVPTKLKAFIKVWVVCRVYFAAEDTDSVSHEDFSALGNDDSAITAFPLLVKKAWLTLFWIKQPVYPLIYSTSPIRHILRPPTGTQGLKALIPMVQLATHRTA